MLERRSLLAGLAALPVAMLPGHMSRLLTADATPAIALPVAFDPSAFVADLRALGCEVYLTRRARSRGGLRGYGIMSPATLGFGEEFRLVMARWDAAIAACPDHVARVAAHLSGTDKETA